MGIQWSVVIAVFKRNFFSYFANPVGYLFIFAFTLAGAYFAFNDQFFAANMADLEQLNLVFPTLTLLLVPAITMSAWADERRSGTEELLLTLPGSDLSIVLGKYFACVGIYTAALVFLAAFVSLLAYLGGPDYGLIFSTYLGYWFIGVALIAAGMAASLLTSHTTVAFILGVLLCGILVGVSRMNDIVFYLRKLIPGLTSPAGVSSASDNFLKDFLPRISVEGTFQQSFGRGLMTLSAFWYFVFVAGLMLSLNVFLLSRRHWAGGKNASGYWLHGTIRFVSLLVAGLSIYVFARRMDSVAFIDSTQEKLHALSKETLDVLRSIPADREVRINAFISPIKELPKDYVLVQRNLREMLLQYEAQSRGKVVLNIEEADLNSEAALRAERSFNIKPVKQGVQEDGRFRTVEFILGVSVRSGTTEQTIPFFYKGLPIEYELTRLVRTASTTDLPKVAILGTEAEILDRFNNDENDWLIVNDLKKQYKVVRAQPGELHQTEEKDAGPDKPKTKEIKRDANGQPIVVDSLKNVKCLIVPMASTLKKNEMDDLLEWLKAGKPTLILEDPVASFNPRITTNNPMMRGGGMQMGMMGGMGQPRDLTGLTRLCEFLGIEMDVRNTVWQTENPLRQEYVDLPLEYLPAGQGVTSEPMFDREHPITAAMKDYVLFLFSGGFKRRGGDGPDVKPLIWSAPDAGITPADAIHDAIMGSRMGADPDWSKKRTKRKNDNVPLYLAAYISGKPLEAPSPTDGNNKNEKKPEAKNLNVVFISDLDFVSNSFFSLRRTGERRLDFENVGFLVNCVDYLTGDDTLIPLRQKRPARHTLQRIEELSRSFERKANAEVELAQAESQKAETEAKAKLDKVLKQYQNRDTISMGELIDIQQKVNAARNEYNQTVEEINQERSDKIRQISFDTQERLKQQQLAIRFLGVALTALPVLIIGLIVYTVRRNRETEGVSRARLR